MDEMLRESIKELKEIVLENNKILRSIRRNARIATAWHIFYWTLIIGSGVASYYFLQPYVNQISDAYKSMQATQQKLSNLPSLDAESIKNYFGGKVK